MRRKIYRRVGLALLAVVIALPCVAAVIGRMIGPGLLHPANLNPARTAETAAMLERTGAARRAIEARAADGAILKGWKIAPVKPNGNWILLFHGISDNRSGVLGHAEILLRNGYSVVMMDSRGHGESGGDMVTYGWKERYDTVALVSALESRETVRHLGALGVSLGAAIALQSAAVEPRIEGVVAEDPFANLREVSYDYAGLDVSPLLGKTLFRPATIAAMDALAEAGNFSPDDVSPEKAVAVRAFPVLLVCGTEDHRIPCRHAERIYAAAIGPKELWIVEGAGHASALGHSPQEYEQRVVAFFRKAITND